MPSSLVMRAIQPFAKSTTQTGSFFADLKQTHSRPTRSRHRSAAAASRSASAQKSQMPATPAMRSSALARGLSQLSHAAAGFPLSEIKFHECAQRFVTHRLARTPTRDPTQRFRLGITPQPLIICASVAVYQTLRGSSSTARSRSRMTFFPAPLTPLNVALQFEYP